MISIGRGKPNSWCLSRLNRLFATNTSTFRESALQRSDPSPNLGRPPVAHHAAHALPGGTWLAIVAPEDMRRAHEPVLVCLVQRHATAVIEQPRPADQRDVVEQGRIPRLAREQCTDAPLVEHRAPELVREQQGERAGAAVERQYLNALFRDRSWLPPAGSAWNASPS